MPEEGPNAVGAMGRMRAPHGPRTLVQVRVYDFDSALQRMSAVVWDAVNQRCFVALKGSPEMVATLCEAATGPCPAGDLFVPPGSPLNRPARCHSALLRRVGRRHAVPSNLKTQLEHYAHQGFRVMAVASKTVAEISSADAAALLTRSVDARRHPRAIVTLNAKVRSASVVDGRRANSDRAECGLTFAGLLILENRLKPETLPALAVLRRANIRTVMVTGTASFIGDRVRRPGRCLTLEAGSPAQRGCELAAWRSGDNSLTAASVAKLCGLLDVEARVYRPLVLRDDVPLSRCRQSAFRGLPVGAWAPRPRTHQIAWHGPAAGDALTRSDPDGVVQVMWARVDDPDRHVQLTTAQLAVRNPVEGLAPASSLCSRSSCRSGLRRVGGRRVSALV